MTPATELVAGDPSNRAGGGRPQHKKKKTELAAVVPSTKKTELAAVVPSTKKPSWWRLSPVLASPGRNARVPLVALFRA